MYGMEKSSRMQDKILDRVMRTKLHAEEKRVELPVRTWTPERWAHRAKNVKQG